MSQPKYTYQTVDILAVERRAQELRGEWTAQALRSAVDWLRSHLHLRKTHTPSA